MPPSFLHIIGARPNIPKAAPVVRALDDQGASQVVVHTGQHYDEGLSASLLRDLGMAEPAVNLGIGSGSHAHQVASALKAVAGVLADVQPGTVVVYGDVNSTLASALAAVHLGIPVAHVEAGLRSGDMSMPEEVNRRLVDHVSAQLMATCEDAMENLAREGLAGPACCLVGNPMIDSLRWVQRRYHLDAERARLGLPKQYALATLHRPANVDEPARAERARSLLADLAARIPLVIPAHPRARRALGPLAGIPGIQLAEPFTYREFIAAMDGARFVLTDSGGVQEETSALGVPCLTLRRRTERPVTVDLGTNQLVDETSALAAVDDVLSTARPIPPVIPWWDGVAGPRIARALLAGREQAQLFMAPA